MIVASTYSAAILDLSSLIFLKKPFHLLCYASIDFQDFRMSFLAVLSNLTLLHHFRNSASISFSHHAKLLRNFLLKIINI